MVIGGGLNEAKMAPRRAKLGEDELSSAKMGIRWAKTDKVSDKMRLDGAKMRKMQDVSSVLGPLRAYGSRKPLQQCCGPGRRGGVGEG